MSSSPHIVRETMVSAAMRLRLTARSLARGSGPHPQPDSAGGLILERAERLAGWYSELAGLLARPTGSQGSTLRAPEFDALSADAQQVGELAPVQQTDVWVALHLDHLRQHLPDVVGPATEVAALRRRPWWR